MRKRRQKIETYRERRDLLNKFGWKLRLSRNPTNAQRGAITRIWKAKRFYITNARKNRIEFVRARSKGALSASRSLVSSSAQTPRGFFFQRPRGVPKGKMRVSVQGKSLVVSIPGRVKDVILKLNTRKILRNPKKAMDDALQGRKKPRQAILVVNEFDSTHAGSPYAVKDFFEYIRDDLIPFLREKRKLSLRKIEDIFKLKLVY